MRLGPIVFQPGGRLRSGWRILLYVILTAFAAQLGLWVYYAAGSFRLAGTMLSGERANLMLLDSLLCTAALASAFVVIRYIDRRPFAALGFSRHGRICIETVQGALFGSAMVTAVFGAEAMTGWGRFSGAGADLKTAMHDGAVYLLTFALAAALEEILARGYVFQALIEGIGSTSAVAITSGLFGLGHALNPHATTLGIVNTVLAGVWLAVAYLKTRSLWLPTAMHLSWNLCLAYIFGFPVSGLRVSGSLLQAQASGPEWLTGGAYGPEGGVLCTAVILLCTAWIMRSGSVRPSPHATALWDTGVGPR